MTEKRKTLLKWIAILACITVLTVGVTLAVCFSTLNNAKTATTAYEILAANADASTTYWATPYGDVLEVNDGLLQTQSLNGKTAVFRWDDKTFTVVSQYGIKYVEKTLNRLSGTSSFLSHDGEVLYFIDNEEFNGGENSLWRYEVATNTLKKIDTITHYLSEGMVSPSGNYFALREVADDGTVTVHLYDKEKEVGRFISWELTLCFVTDGGTVFYQDVMWNFYSISCEGEETAYIKDSTMESALFNRDGTEFILNCTDGCYFYQLKNDTVTAKTKLLEEGGLMAFLPEDVEASYIVNTTSLCDINLKNTVTYQRVKLAKNKKLVAQEGSERMESVVAPGGEYIYYIDDDGDYYYTDTKDVNGKYHLLWEASECDGPYLLGITAKKSLYYLDDDYNLHFVKNGRDTIVCQRDVWREIMDYEVDPFTETIYFHSDYKVYYSTKGSKYTELLESNTVLTLKYASGQVYCYSLGDGSFYKLLPNGRYVLLD